MFNKTLAVTALASVLALGIAAPASAAGDREGRGGHGWHQAGPGPGKGGHQGRAPARGDWRDPRGHAPEAYRGGHPQARPDYRGAPPLVHRMPPPPMNRLPPPMVRPLPPPPPYGWARGMDYRRGYGGPVYMVNDYYRYDLRHPPRGHRWIRDDRGNYLLVAIATGIIADLLLHH